MSRRREQLVPGKLNAIVFETYVTSGNDATIHIDVQSEARLNELETIARKLSTGEVQTVRLSELLDAHWVPPLAEVVLKVSARSTDVRNRGRGEQVICEWADSLDGWSVSTEKIAVMRASVMPCHQYFEAPHADSVTIELAYME